jgi:protein-tyrosine-phosphatase
MVKHILFVCTGNTCRSPLAEGLFRQLAQQEGLEVEIRSAGVSAADGAPISAHSSHILQSRGIDAQGRSNALTPEWTEWADLILAMTSGHKQAIIRRHPEAAGKVYTLKEFVEDDEKVLASLAEMERLAAELQIKRSLSEPVAEEDLQRLRELERAIPDFDISDPFGGPLELYQECAEEIEKALVKLARKLKNQSPDRQDERQLGSGPADGSGS